MDDPATRSEDLSQRLVPRCRARIGKIYRQFDSSAVAAVTARSWLAVHLPRGEAELQSCAGISTGRQDTVRTA